jgi:hypothetical protein
MSYILMIWPFLNVWLKSEEKCNLISIEKSSLSFDGRVGVTDHWDADDAENQTTVDRQPDRNAEITF